MDIVGFYEGCRLCVFTGKELCPERCFECAGPEISNQGWLYSLGLYIPRRSGNGQHYASPWTQAVIAAKRKCQPVIASFGRILAWVILRYLSDFKPALATTVPGYFANPECCLFQTYETSTPGSLLLKSVATNLIDRDWQVVTGLLAQTRQKTVRQRCCHTDRQRERNVQNLYVVPEPERVKGQVIILLDDVVTSGSSLTECSRILYEAGALTVVGLTLAKTVRKNSVVL